MPCSLFEEDKSLMLMAVLLARLSSHIFMDLIYCKDASANERTYIHFSAITKEVPDLPKLLYTFKTTLIPKGI